MNMKDNFEEFQKFIFRQIHAQNSTPLEEIDNISPNELSILIYPPLINYPAALSIKKFQMKSLKVYPL